MSNPSQIQISEQTGIGYSYVSELKSELANSGWIRALGGRRVIPLVGFEAKSSDYPKISEELTIDPGRKSSDSPKISSERSNGAKVKSSDSPKISDDPKISRQTKSSDSPKNSDSPKISSGGKSSDKPKISDDPKISKPSPPRPPYKEVVLKNITTSSSSAEEDGGEEVRSGRKAEDLEREVTEADIAYLQSLPENKGVPVAWVYRKMVFECTKPVPSGGRKKRPTLRRLIDWCHREIRPAKNGSTTEKPVESPDDQWRRHYINELRKLIRHADEAQSCAIEVVLRQLPQLSWEEFEDRRGELIDIGLEVA